MVSSISGIGAYSASIFQSLSTSDSAGTTAGMSFDDMVANGVISNTEDEKASTGITAMGGSSEKEETSSSSGSNSEMDLNNDGQVTMDEIVRYMQMQMADNMSEQMSSEDGSFEMGQQAQQNTGIEEFKTRQAANAYQSGQQLMDSVSDMITDGFMFFV